MDVYELNRQIFDSGIDSGIILKPLNFDADTLEHIATRLADLSKDEKHVLVQWGQDFGGPKNFLRYHPLSDIKNLEAAYQRSGVKSIYPKMGLVIDDQWLEQKPLRTGQKVVVDVTKYVAMVRSLHY